MLRDMKLIVHFGVAPHPEMVHSVPSGSGPSVRQAVFTNFVSLAHWPLTAFSFSRAVSRECKQKKITNSPLCNRCVFPQTFQKQ